MYAFGSVEKQPVDDAWRMRDLNALTDQAATPWDKHEVFGSDGAQFAPADESFRHSYGDFG